MFLTIKLYLCETELFEIERFICIKMDLALNNPQREICNKTQTNKQTNKQKESYIIIATYAKGGARDVMVIIVRNGDGDPRSKPGRGILHFT